MINEEIIYDSVINSIYFDKKHQLFILGDKKVATNGLIVYINRIEYNNELAYAYVNVGNTYLGATGPGYIRKIYNGYNQNELVIEGENITIDESNYKKFKEYKYTFQKDEEGNYYFLSIE